MVSRVEGFRAADGTFFDTEQEAALHEAVEGVVVVFAEMGMDREYVHQFLELVRKTYQPLSEYMSAVAAMPARLGEEEEHAETESQETAPRRDTQREQAIFRELAQGIFEAEPHPSEAFDPSQLPTPDVDRADLGGGQEAIASVQQQQAGKHEPVSNMGRRLKSEEIRHEGTQHGAGSRKRDA